MKSIYSVIILLLTGCEFYNLEIPARVTNISQGKLVVTSSESNKVITDIDSRNIRLNLKKGLVYSISYYREFGDTISRFPSGNIVKGGVRNINLSPYYGSVAEICNTIDVSGGEFKYNDITELKDFLLQQEDPWRLNKDDMYLYCKGDISIHSIRKERVIDLPELIAYKGWEPENVFFHKWYRSVQSFYDEDTHTIFRIEVFDDGSYHSFIDVNFNVN